MTPTPTHQLKNGDIEEHRRPRCWGMKVLVYAVFVVVFVIMGSSKSKAKATLAKQSTCKVTEQQVLKYASKAELSLSVGEHVANIAKEAGDGKVLVALSGGSAPQLLADGILNYAEQIKWENWHIFFADERYVEESHPDSNFKACFDAFLSKVRIPLENVYRLDNTVPVEQAAIKYQAQLEAVSGTKFGQTDPPRFNLILLGMGPDGHTCSLFPGHDLLTETGCWVAPIKDSPKPPPERITLTYPVLDAAANIFFLAAGGGKADMLSRVIISGDELTKQGSDALPSARVRPKDGNVIWFVDNDAAAKL